MTGHTAFEIELSGFCVPSAGSSQETRAEVIGRQNVHLRVTVHTEAALLVARAAPEVGQMRIVAVTT